MQRTDSSTLSVQPGNALYPRLILIMTLFHISIMAASNYLVQIPFQIFGLHTTWGAFTFPFVFLATDLTVRLFGHQPARQIIFWAMFPALIVSYLVSVMFSEGSFQTDGLNGLNTFVARIALASFTAYLVGQLLDITIFDRLRRMRHWWVAPATSTIIGNLVDTLSFFWVAFHNSSDPFMAENWLEIAIVDYGWKLAISMVFFLPLYGMMLNALQNRLTHHQPRPDAKLQKA